MQLEVEEVKKIASGCFSRWQKFTGSRIEHGIFLLALGV
jgi:hypothetical protein